MDPNSMIGASAEYRAGDFGIGLSFTNAFYPPYEVYVSMTETEGTFTQSQMKGGFGLAYKLPWNLSLGLEAKYLRSNLSPTTSYESLAGSMMLNLDLKSFSVSVGVEKVR